MQTRKKIFLITALLYIIYTIFPLFSNSNLFPVWIPSAITFVLISFLYPDFFKSKFFFCFLLYAAVIFLFMKSGRKIKLDIGIATDFRQLLIEFAFLLPSLEISYVLLKIKDLEVVNKMFRYVLVFLFVSFVIVIPMLNTTDLRTLTTTESVESNAVMGYTLLHAYVIVFPAMIYCWRSNRKLILLALLVLLSIIILKSSITTTILIWMSILLISIAIRLSNNKLIVIPLSFLVLFIVIAYYSGVMLKFLYFMNDVFEGTAVSLKIEDAIFSMETGASSDIMSTRQFLHKLSWNSFCDNILIGGGNMGGHSCILDRLASYGLVGFIPYFMIYYLIVKSWTKKICVSNDRVYYFLGVCAAVVILYSKGLFGQEGNVFLMVLLPLIIYREQETAK